MVALFSTRLGVFGRSHSCLGDWRDLRVSCFVVDRGMNYLMPLYWLCYRHHNQISVVIEPGASIVHARMRAALAELDQGEFTEGHELPGNWKVAKKMIGRRLSQEEAKRLLAKLD